MIKRIITISARIVVFLWGLAISFIDDLRMWIKKETPKIGPPD